MDDAAAEEPSDSGGYRTSPEKRATTIAGLGLLLAMGIVAWLHILEIRSNYRPPELRGVKVNVNTADVDTLSLLPEIGPERARKIVEYRESVGRIRGYPDLLEITGIGEKTLDGLIGQITFRDEPPRDGESK